MPSRRAVLAAGVAALAGCAGFSGDAGTSPTDVTTTTPDGSTTTRPTENDLSFDYETAWLQDAYFGQTTTGHIGLIGRPDEQYLMVSGLPDDDARSLAAVLDGETFPAAQQVPPDRVGRTVVGAVVAVPVPRRGATEGHLELQNARASLPGDVLTGLATPPVFDLLAVEVPDRVTAGASFTVTLRVARTGGRDEPFRAAAGPSWYSTLTEWLRIDVPRAGETTHDFTMAAPEEPGPIEAVVEWRGGTVRREVPVENA